MLSTLCVRTTGFALAVQGAPRHLPAVVLRAGQVLEANTLARRAGVANGMPLSAVRAICADAVILQEDAETAASLRERWMRRCARFALATEPLDEHTVLLDWRGFADGGRSAIKTLVAEAKRAGLSLRLGYSVGRLSAQVALRLARPLCVLPPPLSLTLQEVPLHLLPAPYAPVVERCRRLGWKTFGDLRSLSASLLRQMVGEQALPVWYLAQGYDSVQVRPLYPPPSWQTSGDFPPLLLEENVLATWYRVARAIATHAHGAGVEKLCLVLQDEHAHTQRLQATFPQPLSSCEAIYAQIRRLWQHRNQRFQPVRWRVYAQWSAQGKTPQLALDAPASCRRELDDTLRYLQLRFGTRACFLWNEHHLDWKGRMRYYYGADSLALYQDALTR